MDVLHSGASSWSVFSTGTAVGNKHIDVLSAPLQATKLRLTVTESEGEPVILDFAAFAPCPL